MLSKAAGAPAARASTQAFPLTARAVTTSCCSPRVTSPDRSARAGRTTSTTRKTATTTIVTQRRFRRPRSATGCTRSARLHAEAPGDSHMNAVSARRNSTGFTLLEHAVSLSVIALLLGSIMVPLQTQIENRKIDETKRMLDVAQELLLGFAAAHGYFPCPATATSAGHIGRASCRERVEMTVGE